MHLRKCYLLYNMHFMQKDNIGETGRRLGDRFCEHVREVERNDYLINSQTAQTRGVEVSRDL